MTFDELRQSIADGGGAAELHVYLKSGGVADTIDSRSGWPLLHLACEHQNLEMIQALVSNGADCDGLDSSGQSALHLAVDIDIDSIVQSGGSPSDLTFATTRLLLKLGANCDIRDRKGQTPRDWAANYGDLALEQFDKLIRQ